ncbi:MAG: alcohol dehydrogenase catalytic domain-containing protein [Candidatus Aminicenantes bacterium]|nr:MAG: alcohol dehydrogenase catalytic domain-containing protein [Candidatus Aminicenantes bacterium]
MRQARLVEPEKLILEEVDIPEFTENQVLIKVKRIGICGSDIHAYYDKHPYISCPIVQGHEFSGEIASVGEKVQGFSEGDRVTVMPQLVCGDCYPCTHGNYHICNALKVIGCQEDGAAREFIPVDHKLVVKLPEGMSLDYGAMVEPVAVGVHAVKRLGNVGGMNLLILGAGPIGNLTAQSAKGLGARAVLITDISDYRLEVAKNCGIDHPVNVSFENLDTKVEEYFGRDGADAILECVGVEETIEFAIHLARKGTDVVVVGVFGEKPSVDIGLVQDKELRMIGTLMYRAEDYRIAIDLIQSKNVHLDPLISQHFAFEDYPKAFEFIEKHQDKTMKVLVDL